jgi:hypothetical protein
MRSWNTIKPVLGSTPSGDWIAQTGCVGLWLMNEGGGGKIYDLSGRDNTGTLTGMANPSTATSGWGAGKFGSALNFDGSNDYVIKSGKMISSGSFTFEIIARPQAYGPDSYGAIILSQSPIYIAIGYTDVKVFLFTVDTSNSIASSVVNLGTTYHVVGVYNINDASKLRIYLDGKYQSTGNYTASYAGTTVEFGVPSSHSRYFNGNVELGRIYNKALSAQEIARLYATPFYMFPKRSAVSYFIPATGGVGLVFFQQYYNRLRGN